MTFGEKLRALRYKKKFSKTKLAQELGISRQIWAVYESDTTMPSTSLFITIADYFNVSADYLLGREQFMNTPCNKNGNNHCIFLPEELSEAERLLIRDLVETVCKHSTSTDEC